MNRRSLLKQTLFFGSAVMTGAGWAGKPTNAAGVLPNSGNHKFQMDLCGGRVGIDADQNELMRLANKHGFAAVEPLGWELEKLEASQIDELNEKRESLNLVWSAAGLPTDFRKSEKDFTDGLAQLPAHAKKLQRAGVTRIGTWIMPCHDTLTYLENFHQHAKRLKQICKILGDHDLRLGLEYVGTKTLWSSKKFPFLHTMDEALELVSQTGAPNIGLVLDSWHWTLAGENGDDIRRLTNELVIACDLNDAPVGIDNDDQIDSQRELPMATGVIDTQGFLQALFDIDYDGPIRAEPFSQSLNEKDNAAAAKATAEAMKKAFATLG